MRPAPHRGAAVALLVIAALLTPAAADDGPSAKGRALFNGEGEPAARLMATAAGRAASAARLPCASCHGRDGLGRKEADVLAPAIVRGAGGLDRAGRTPAGDMRPAYDRGAFAAALAAGIAPDGRTLSDRMPRYDASADDIDALWAWLDEMGAEQRQGVEREQLRFSVVGLPGHEAQAARIVSALGSHLEPSPARFGRRIALRSEVWRPGEDECPGANALAIVIASLDEARAVLDAARRCAVPAIVPFHDLAGNENALDVRGMSATLQQQWRMLRDVAGPRAATVVPDGLSAWEEEALRFAGLRSAPASEPQDASDGARPVLFLPFGLDRARLPARPAIVAAPFSGSRASYKAWLEAGHDVRLAVASPVAGLAAPPADAMPRLVADLLDRASLATGPAPTRAAFMDAVDRAVLRLAGRVVLDYPAYRLTGSRDVVILDARR